MLFNKIGLNGFRRCAFAIVLANGLSACVALDEYINPYYDDEPEVRASADEEAGSVSDQAVAQVPGERDAETGGQQPNNNSLGTDASPGEEVAAPSLLATIGPNPFLASTPKPSASAQSQYESALSAMRAEDWASAERLFGELVRGTPRLSGPMLNLGIAQTKQGKDELAQQSFERAIEINRSNQEAYNQLGLLHRKHGRFDQAKATYLRAISEWPGYPPIRLNLGILFELYIGDLTRALNQYQAYQSLQTEPDRKVNGWIKDLQRRLQVSPT